VKPETLCVCVPRGEDPYDAVSPPIYQTATFRQESATELGEYDYTRSGNPTRTILEEHLARLEGGSHGFAFSSGMAALSALMRLLQTGDEILAGDDLYGGTFRLLGKVLPRMGIAAKLVDATDPAKVRAAITDRTKLLLVETPSNPRLQICDIVALSAVARERGVRFAVDNSLLSPLQQQPLRHGADIVIHSGTKAFGGHSDATAGALIVNDEALARELKFFQNAEGTGLAPFECWLLLRGIKTLSLRTERQSQSARLIAEYLSCHSQVGRVYYPGLSAHPGRQIHERQATGGGPVLSFTTGDAVFSKRLVEAARIFCIAVSFGSVHSTISLPLHMSHASTPQHLRSGDVGQDLVRLSVGVEAASDLIADLDRAIDAATAVSRHPRRRASSPED
jgi:cystathionine beta-lyase